MYRRTRSLAILALFSIPLFLCMLLYSFEPRALAQPYGTGALFYGSPIAAWMGVAPGASS